MIDIHSTAGARNKTEAGGYEGTGGGGGGGERGGEETKEAVAKIALF